MVIVKEINLSVEEMNCLQKELDSFMNEMTTKYESLDHITFVSMINSAIIASCAAQCEEKVFDEVCEWLIKGINHSISLTKTLRKLKDAGFLTESVLDEMKRKTEEKIEKFSKSAPV